MRITCMSNSEDPDKMQQAIYHCLHCLLRQCDFQRKKRYNAMERKTGDGRVATFIARGSLPAVTLCVVSIHWARHPPLCTRLNQADPFHLTWLKNCWLGRKASNKQNPLLFGNNILRHPDEYNRRLQINCVKSEKKRPNKNRCVPGNGSENFSLGRHTFFFSGKYDFLHFERRNAFKCIKSYFPQREPEKEI